MDADAYCGRAFEKERGLGDVFGVGFEFSRERVGLFLVIGKLVGG